MGVISRLILLWVLGLLCFAPSLHAAAPGLPFTEDFENADLKNSTETTADWISHPTDGKLILAWRRAMFGPFGSATAGSDIGTDKKLTKALALGDVDGDGDTDLVVGNANEANMLYLGDGAGGFGDGTVITADAHNTSSIALGDMDGDGDLDVVVGNDNYEADRLYLNDGAGDPFDSLPGGTGTIIKIASPYFITLAIAVADVNGDGHLDVVTGTDMYNQIYLNDGTTDPFNGVSGSNVSADTDDTYAIALGDVDGDGYLDVVAGNAGSDPADQNKLCLGNGDGTFDAGVIITADGNDTYAIALGDMDGDGDIDVVAGDVGAASRLYLNNGTATPFTDVTGSDIDVANTTYAIAVCDVDNDGDFDVVTGNAVAGTKRNRLYLNNGTADPFSGVTGSDITTDGHDTYAVALADLDGDGDLDLVAGNTDDVTTPNQLYLNPVNYNPFNGVTGSNITPGNDTEAVALADLSGDGNLDLVIGNTGSVNRICLGDGAGGFGVGTDIDAVGRDTMAIALGDMNGNGKLDLVTGNSVGINRIFIGDGAGGFDVGTNIGAIAYDTRSIALGDMNGNGKLDLVIGNLGDFNRIYLGDGAGDFGAGADIAGSDTTNTCAVAMADMDSDGNLDLVTGNDGTDNRIYLGDGAGDFGAGADIAGSDTTNTCAVALADMDGDGNLDLVTGNSGGFNRIYLGDGAGGWGGPGADIAGSDTTNTYAVALVDMNGDGNLDLVTGNSGADNRIYLGDGVGGFDGGTDIDAAGSATLAIALADVDADGDIDVVTGNGSGETNRLYLNARGPLGSSGMTGSNISSDTDNTVAIAIGDVDGNGSLDVITANDGQINKIYPNDGDGDPFLPVVVGVDIGTETTDFTRDIAIADVDGDGHLDVVTGNNGQINRLYLNDGVGDPFEIAGTDIGTETTDNTQAVAIADVNGDGYLDVVAGNNGQINRLYINDKDSDPFQIAGDTVGSADADETWAIALADMDGDGDIDVVAGNLNMENKLYLNDGDLAPFSGVVTGDDIGTDDDGTNSIALGDVDGDGDIDVVAGNWGSTNKLYLNDGDLAPFSDADVGDDIGTDTDYTWVIALADVDGDGDLDVVAGNPAADETNKLYLNNGTATPFNGVTGTDITADMYDTRGIALADVDSNGGLDVVVGNDTAPNRLYRRALYDTIAGKAVSLEVDTEDTDDIVNALVTVTGTMPPNTRIDWYISNNSGTQWFQIISGRVIIFPATVTGKDLRWKAEMHSLSPHLTPEVTEILIESDNIPPTAGEVYDGIGADIDEQSELDTIRANWTGFADVGTGIASYDWAIGTVSGGTDIQGWTNIGNVTSATNSDLLGIITSGPTYYVSVRAIDYANNVDLVDGVASSDGVKIVLTVQFDAPTSEDAEPVTPALLPVSLSAVATGVTTIDYAVAESGGTATGGGVDYTLASGTLTFDVGDQTKNISITIVNDTNFELDETIIVELSNPSNATLVEASKTHTYKIINEDPEPDIYFAVATSTGIESAEDDAVITISLSGTTIYDATVDYKVTGGSATSGADYTLADGTLTIAIGELSGDITIAVVDDIWGEPDETVEITISNENNAILSEPSTHIFTITHAGHRVTFTTGSGGGCFLSREKPEKPGTPY